MQNRLETQQWIPRYQMTRQKEYPALTTVELHLKTERRFLTIFHIQKICIVFLYMYIYIYLYRCNHPLFFFFSSCTSLCTCSTKCVKLCWPLLLSMQLKSHECTTSILYSQHTEHSYLSTHSVNFLTSRYDKKNAATTNLFLAQFPMAYETDPSSGTQYI